MNWRAAHSTIIVLVVVCAAGGFVAAAPHIWRLPDVPPDITDSRACPHSTAELSEVAEHFGLVLPADATGVRFSADFNPMFGEYNLRLRFETTPAGLRTLTTASGFTTPTTADPTTVPAPADCPGPLASHQLLMAKSEARTLVVDTANPSHPQVYLEAFDL